MSASITTSPEAAGETPGRGGVLPIRVATSVVHEFGHRPWRSVAMIVLLLLTIAGLGTAGLYLWATYHFRAAKDAARHHKIEDARKHLKHCLKIWPSSSDANFLAAQCARRAGAFDEASTYLTKCQNIDGGITERVQRERILLRAAAGDLGSVEMQLWNYLSAENKSPPSDEEAALIYECLGVSYMMNESRPGTALHCLKKTLELDPSNLLALHGRAWVFERMSNFPEAEADLRRVLDLNPTDMRAKVRLAGVLFSTSRAPDALKLYEEALQTSTYKNDPVVIVGIARCKQELGQAEEAARILDDFLEKVAAEQARKARTPENAGALTTEALTERGKIALQSGDGAAAEKFLRQAVANNPFDRQSNHALYICLSQLGKEKEAQELLPKLRQIEADIAKLMELFHTEMDARPRDPEPLFEIGKILLRNGQAQTGLYWLQKALLYDERHQPTNKLLAKYYDDIGNKTTADKYRRMLVSRPGEPEAPAKDNPRLPEPIARLGVLFLGQPPPF